MPSISMAQELVLYCSDEEATGFITKENYKRATFTNERFTLKADFDNFVLAGELDFLGNQRTCHFSEYT